MPAYNNFLGLDDLSNEPIPGLEKKLAELVAFRKHGLPLPACLVVTKQALMRATLLNPLYNQFQQDINKLKSQLTPQSEKKQLTTKIHRQITALTLPMQFTSEFYRSFDQIIKNKTVDIFNATGSIKHSRIQGVTDIFKTILKIWADDFTQLTPTHIIIMAQPEHRLSGTITNKHPQAQHRAWLHMQIADKDYWLDQRSWQFVHLPKPSNEDLRDLINIGQKSLGFFQSQLENVTLHWCLDQENLPYFTQMSVAVCLNTKPQVYSLHTATKLYISATTLAQCESIINQTDGVLALNGETLFHAQGVHPLQLVKRSHLRENLANLIQTTINKLSKASNTSKLIAYRSYAAPADQRLKLQYAHSYETPAANPYIGQRGPHLAIEYPQIFEFELSVLKKVAAQSNQPLSLVIPWLRTQYEFQFLYKIISRSEITQFPHFSIYLELNTPGLILSEMLPKAEVAGFMLNAQDVGYISLGQDPTQFSLDTANKEFSQLVKSLMTHLTTQTNNQGRKLVLLDTQLHPELVNHAIQLGWHGVSTLPNLINEAKSAMLKTERQLIEKAISIV